MSSTNRGGKRVPNDFYETPSWCVEKLLPYLPASGGVLDPCAGRGAILDAAASLGSPSIGYDIDPNCGRFPTCDSLTIEWPMCSVVLMNPPFSRALEFVKYSLKQQARHRGITCALLRLSFLSSIGRAEFLKESNPDVFVLSKRPSFTGGGTDSCDYAWFYWSPNSGGHWAIL